MSGTVEQYRARYKHAYTTLEMVQTVFTADEDQNGTWDVGAEGFLYFIKTNDLESNQIEVNVAMFVDRPDQKGYRIATGFAADEGANGVWRVERIP